MLLRDGEFHESTVAETDWLKGAVAIRCDEVAAAGATNRAPPVQTSPEPETRIRGNRRTRASSCARVLNTLRLQRVREIEESPVHGHTMHAPHQVVGVDLARTLQNGIGAVQTANQQKLIVEVQSPGKEMLDGSG